MCVKVWTASNNYTERNCMYIRELEFIIIINIIIIMRITACVEPERVDKPGKFNTHTKNTLRNEMGSNSAGKHSQSIQVTLSVNLNINII